VIMLDLHPGPSGTFGQLLNHGGVDPPEQPVDSGLNNYLKTLIYRLEHDEVFYKDGMWWWTKPESRPISEWDNPDSIL
jgi:cell wall assembly regulator SMI1